MWIVRDRGGVVVVRGRRESDGNVMSIGVCERWLLVCSVDVGEDGVIMDWRCCGVVIQMVGEVSCGVVGDVVVECVMVIREIVDGIVDEVM